MIGSVLACIADGPGLIPTGGIVKSMIFPLTTLRCIKGTRHDN